MDELWNCRKTEDKLWNILRSIFAGILQIKRLFHIFPVTNHTSAAFYLYRHIQVKASYKI
jgi:hypothetical protein